MNVLGRIGFGLSSISITSARPMGMDTNVAHNSYTMCPPHPISQPTTDGNKRLALPEIVTSYNSQISEVSVVVLG